MSLHNFYVYLLSCFNRDISWSLVSDPAIWKLALAMDTDAVAFLKAFQAMRTGYKNGTFRYAVMVFEKQS